MMTNLFSIFDPHTSMDFSLNWLSLFIPFFFFPKSFWFSPSKTSIWWKKIFYFLFNELSKLLNKNNWKNIFMFLSIFYIYLIMNFIGLYPYIFTPSSHLMVTLSLSLSVWMGMMIYSWTNHMNHSFAHLVPMGTPTLLMSFMVIIETISNIIRPGTLAIRLSANMIAGHLLLSLLGSTGPNLMIYMISILITTQIMLFNLEMAVSIIQAYVFMTLSSLYSNETS